jgi:hypothetical protein
LGLLHVGCASDDAPIAAPQNTGLAAKVCTPQPGQQVVAPSADGKRVAFLSCAAIPPTVVVHDLSSNEEVELGPSKEHASIEWLPAARTDEPEKYVLFGRPNELWLRAADGTSGAVLVSSESTAVHHAVLQRVSSTEFAPRLHVFESTGDGLSLSVRGAEDGYVEPVPIYMGSDVKPDLSQISASGRTLILTPSAEGANYVQVQWNTTQSAWQTSALSFGPAQWVMAPVGLGDTHNSALHEDQLVRVELKTGKVEEIVATGGGLLDDPGHLVDREDAPGVKYIYYIANGDPTRRDRDGLMAPETLAQANAVAQRLSPDLSTLLYLSDGALYAVPAEGGEARALETEDNATGRIDAAFPKTGSSVAYTVGSSIYRIQLADGSASKISEASGVQGVASYDGTGSAILFLDEADSLMRVPGEARAPEEVVDGVSGFWPLASSSKVLAVSDGILKVFSFDAP